MKNCIDYVYILVFICFSTNIVSPFEIDGGLSTTCASTTGGTLYCWGANSAGQVGNGGINSPIVTPTPVSGMSSGVVKFGVGAQHTCALGSNGALYCWGKNNYGQVGDGTTVTPITSPAAVSGMSSSVTSIAVGGYYSCAIKLEALFCWGLNSYGQLGDNTGLSRSSPVAVSGMSSDVIAVAVGDTHSCALKSNGAMYCWGYNLDGRVGDGTKTSRRVPVAVSGLSSGVAVIALGSSHSCVVSTGGAMFCWGSNFNSQLGDNSAVSKSTAVAVSGMSSGVTAIAAGGSHSCAVVNDDKLYCWGNNDNGQLGDGTVETRSVPSLVYGMTDAVISVAAGDLTTCAVTSVGALYCWGANDNGQVGDGTTATPQLSLMPASGLNLISPSLAPTLRPSAIPVFQPTSQPTSNPSSQPISQPSRWPVPSPTAQPTTQPYTRPTNIPTVQPTCQPSSRPSRQPFEEPSRQPSSQPSASPSNSGSANPTGQPSSQPSVQPSTQPSRQLLLTPTCPPFAQPSARPSCQPSSQPTQQPSIQPTHQPSLQPISRPSSHPSQQPTPQPTQRPNGSPTGQPTQQPTPPPTQRPNGSPTGQPTQPPTSQPSDRSTCQPSTRPTSQPTQKPSFQPTSQPTQRPNGSPTGQPTQPPTSQPSDRSTCQPSIQPTSQPTQKPSSQPTCLPSAKPSLQPSLHTFKPSCQPSGRPSSVPSQQPSQQPSRQPISLPTSNLLSITLSDSLLSTNGTGTTGLASHTVTEVEKLLAKSTSSLLSSFNFSAPSNGSISVTTVSFSTDMVKTSLSAVAFPNMVVSNNTNTSSAFTMSIQVSIPSSSNSVSFSIPRDVVGLNSVGAMLSVIELSSSLMGSVGNSSHTFAAGNSLSAISSPVLDSNIVTVSFAVVSKNLSLSKPILPIFEANLNVFGHDVSSGDSIGLYHNCTVGVIETISVLCATSQVWLNVTCSGKAFAAVKRACPVYSSVCAVLNLADNTIASTGYCETIHNRAGAVLCRCGYDADVAKNESMTLSAFNGRVSIAAVGSFAPSRLDATAMVVARPIGEDVTSESVIVFIAFGALWVLGMFSMVTTYWSLQYSTKIQQSSDTETSLHCKSDTYFSMVVPPPLRMETSSLQRIFQVLCMHHKELRLVVRFFNLRSISLYVNEPLERRQCREMLDVVYVLTSLTLSCFIMAVFYDLQSPVDDGYCGQWTDAFSCHVTKTALDPQVNKCQWLDRSSALVAAVVMQSSSTSGKLLSSSVVTTPALHSDDKLSDQCLLNTDTLSSRAFLLAFLITAIVSILVQCALDVMFRILHASVSDVSIQPINDGFQSVQLSHFSSMIPNPVEKNTQHELSNSEVLIPHFIAEARSHWIKSLSSFPFQQIGNGASAAHIGETGAGVEILQSLIVHVSTRNNNLESKYSQHVLTQFIHHWLPERYSISTVYWQYSMWVILICAHAGAWYFLLAKAAVRGFGWQISFFRATVWEILTDIFFIQVVEILLLDYALIVHLFGAKLKYALAVLRASALEVECLPDRPFHSMDVWSSQELHRLLQVHAHIPEVRIAEATLQLSEINWEHQQNQNRGVLHGISTCCRQGVLWCLYWLPSEVVQSVVTMVAASLATLGLYLYLFVLAPAMSEGLALLVLLLPLCCLGCVWILRNKVLLGRTTHTQLVLPALDRQSISSEIKPSPALAEAEEEIARFGSGDEIEVDFESARKVRTLSAASRVSSLYWSDFDGVSERDEKENDDNDNWYSRRRLISSDQELVSTTLLALFSDTSSLSSQIYISSSFSSYAISEREGSVKSHPTDEDV